MSEQARRVYWIGSLGRRVLAAFLVVSLVPLLLTAMLSYRQTAGLMEAFLEENVAKTARSYASDLDLFLERRRFALRSIPTAVGDTAEILRSVVDGDPNVEALWVMSAAGATSASSGEIVPWAHDACRALLADPNQAMTHAGAGHAHAVIVAVPVEEGVLCGQVSFTLHQDMLTSRAASIAGGTAYIVDRSGTVVCHAFEDHEPHISRGETLIGPAVEIASLAVPWTGTGTGEDGDTFASFAPSKTLPWGVWVEVPREQAVAPLRASLAWIVGTAGGLALLSLFLAVVLVRRLVSPIEDVVVAVKGITMGNYGALVPVRGED